MRNKIIIIILVVSTAIGFGLGGFLGYKIAEQRLNQIQVVVNNSGKTSDVDMNLFWKVWSVIENKYVKRDSLDRKNMIYGAIGGLVDSLEDPYSVFMKPADSKVFSENLSGLIGGIGAEMTIKNNNLTVVAPLEDSPAQKAGLLTGDVVFEVDGKNIVGMNLDDAIKLIRGEKGTSVNLKINREGLSQPKSFIIVRDIIKIPNYKFEIKNNVPIVKLFNFNNEIPNDFKFMVEKVLKLDNDKLIIDLRNNPGGYLESAVSVASWILPKGDVVAIENYGNGKKDEYRSYGYKALEKYKIVILVNEGSASASEILAGALRDVKGIKIIGEKTFGKGVVQELENFTDGSSVKITTAKWFTPKGTSINEEGIKPDIIVPMTEKDITNGKDPQLQKALEIVNSLKSP